MSIANDFDCLSRDLLIAKLHSYGLSLTSIRLLSDYLSNRKQRIKVENVFSKWENIETGVPQGSILGSLLFNIFVCDLFLILDNAYFARYADDNTPTLSTKKTSSDQITGAAMLSISLLSWFQDNTLKLNLDKCHLIVSGTKNTKMKLDHFTNTNSQKEKLLCIIFSNRLKFQYHVWKKASLSEAHYRMWLLSPIYQKEYFIIPFSVTV